MLLINTAAVSAPSRMKERTAETGTVHLPTRLPSWHVCTCASLLFCLFNPSPTASRIHRHHKVRRTKTVFVSAGGVSGPQAPTMASCGAPCYPWSSHRHGDQHSSEPPSLPLLGGGGPSISPLPSPSRVGAAGDAQPGHWVLPSPGYRCPSHLMSPMDRGSVRYGARAQSTQQEETEGKKGLVFTPPGCSKLRGRWEHWESTGSVLDVCNTAGFLLPPTQIPCGDSSPAVTDRQPLIITDITSLRSPGKDGTNTLTWAAKCSWRWVVRGVFCCPKGSGRGPLSAAFLFLYAPSVLLLRKLYGGKFLCFRQ